MSRSSSPCQIPESSQIVPAEDVIKWENTQPALQALWKDSSRPEPTRRVFSGSTPTFLSPDDPSSPVKPTRSNKRPPTRHKRPRMSEPILPSHSTNTPISLTSPFEATDGQMTFTEMLKSVSKLVDENARIKKKHLTKSNKRKLPDGPFYKGKPDTVRAQRLELTDTTNTSFSKGKPRAGEPLRFEPMSMDVSMDVDASFSSMDVDTSTPKGRTGKDILPSPSSSLSKMPPPPLPAKVINRMHPPVPPMKRSTSSVATPSAPPPISSTPPTASALPLSQSRPPVLGMRRTVSTPNSLTPDKQLPTKRPGFKPPFAKGTATSSQQSSSRPSMNVGSSMESPMQISSSSTPSMSAGTRNEDSDGSFEDLSIDMDLLEETMKEYD